MVEIEEERVNVTVKHYFATLSFQAIVTPLSEYLLGWKELENSIAYCFIAFEVGISFLCACMDFITN